MTRSSIFFALGTSIDIFNYVCKQKSKNRNVLSASKQNNW